MSGSSTDWNHAGISEIKENDGSYTVRIPDRLFKEDVKQPAKIFDLGRRECRIYWWVEIGTRVAAISNVELTEKDEYRFVDAVTFQEGDSEYISTIPRKFFPGYKGRGNPKETPEIVKFADLPTEGYLHFVYNEEMVSRDPKSCFVLTDEQFSDRFGDSGRFDLDNVPKFS